VPGLTALPPRAGFGRLAVQPRAAATLTVDGIPRFPDLAAGELRVLDLPPGGHRVELRTGDGRRAAATVDLRDGELADLLGVELQ
jgi:serine/threonine-protein kinase